MITIPGLENYFGGKGASGTYQTIINEIPPHDNYIEPFLGAGNILRRKLPAKSINKGLDLDKNIIDIWDKYAPGNFDIKQGDGIMLLNSLAAGNHLFINRNVVETFTTVFYHLTSFGGYYHSKSANNVQSFFCS